MYRAHIRFAGGSRRRPASRPQVAFAGQSAKIFRCQSAGVRDQPTTNNIRRLAVSVLALSLTTVALAPSASSKPFTAAVMASLDRIDDPRVSPDGRYVLYALRTVDFAANKASKSL